MNIFERLHAGETVPFSDPDYGLLFEGVDRTMKLLAQFNAAADFVKMREILSLIIKKTVHENTTVFAPFNTNYGDFIELGENVFINHGCTFLALGRIILGDDVMIGPGVKLISEGHPIDPLERKSLFVKPVVIKNNVWIGADATVLPGVTVGENSVIAACALVNKDIPANTVVGGIPAKILRTI